MQERIHRLQGDLFDEGSLFVVIGDLVEIGGAYGRVDTITMRSYTNFPRLRLDVEVTVAVTEDLDESVACSWTWSKLILGLLMIQPRSGAKRRAGKVTP